MRHGGSEAAVKARPSSESTPVEQSGGAEPSSTVRVPEPHPSGNSSTPATTLSVSVVVCTYTDLRWTDFSDAIESLRRQESPPHEIIVVVDYNPSLFERVCADMPWVVAVQNRATRGLSGARNTGIETATGDVVAFLDDDATAAPDWLARIRARYQNPEVVAVGGPGAPVWRSGRPSWFPEEFNWVVGCAYRGLPETAAPVRNLIGCNMSFRREVFETVGGFRPEVGRVGDRPIGCEETELCIRVTNKWPRALVLYDPDALVHHRVPAPRATWRYFRNRCYSEGLSKAIVARLAGARKGLASEKVYTFKILPQAAFRGVTDAVVRRQAAGLARAGAIVAGLGFTAAGYARGRLSGKVSLGE